jgi:hypothetical protein
MDTKGEFESPYGFENDWPMLPFLILCNTTLIPNWTAEAQRYLDPYHFRLVAWTNDPSFIRKIKKTTTQDTIVIASLVRQTTPSNHMLTGRQTSLANVKSPFSQERDVPWDTGERLEVSDGDGIMFRKYVVISIDEAHESQNTSSQAYINALRLRSHSSHCVLATATPIPNYATVRTRSFAVTMTYVSTECCRIYIRFCGFLDPPSSGGSSHLAPGTIGLDVSCIFACNYSHTGSVAQDR